MARKKIQRVYNLRSKIRKISNNSVVPEDVMNQVSELLMKGKGRIKIATALNLTSAQIKQAIAILKERQAAKLQGYSKLWHIAKGNKREELDRCFPTWSRKPILNIQCDTQRLSAVLKITEEEVMKKWKKMLDTVRMFAILFNKNQANKESLRDEVWKWLNPLSQVSPIISQSNVDEQPSVSSEIDDEQWDYNGYGQPNSVEIEKQLLDCLLNNRKFIDIRRDLNLTDDQVQQVFEALEKQQSAKLQTYATLWKASKNESRIELDRFVASPWQDSYTIPGDFQSVASMLKTSEKEVKNEWCNMLEQMNTLYIIFKRKTPIPSNQEISYKFWQLLNSSSQCSTQEPLQQCVEKLNCSTQVSTESPLIAEEQDNVSTKIHNNQWNEYNFAGPFSTEVLDCVWNYLWEGKKLRGIGASLGLSQSEVRQTLDLIRKELSEKLRTYRALWKAAKGDSSEDLDRCFSRSVPMVYDAIFDISCDSQSVARILNVTKEWVENEWATMLKTFHSLFFILKKIPQGLSNVAISDEIWALLNSSSQFSLHDPPRELVQNLSHTNQVITEFSPQIADNQYNEPTEIRTPKTELADEVEETWTMDDIEALKMKNESMKCHIEELETKLQEKERQLEREIEGFNKLLELFNHERWKGEKRGEN